MTRFDAIVVGAGGIGSAVLAHLAKLEAKVLGIDRFEPPHNQGSTYGGTRLIRRAYFEDPRYIPLAENAFKAWRWLENECETTLLHRTGLLVISDGGGAGAQIESVARAHDIAFEVLPSDAVRRRFRQFALDDAHVGLHERDAGWLDVEGGVRAHLDVAKRSPGSTLEFGARVRSWSSDGKTVRVTTDAGVREADSLVLAPGAWSNELIGPLPLPLTVRRGPQFWFNAKAGRDVLEQGPCFAFAIGGGFVYGFPAVNGLPVKVANYQPSDVVIGDPLARAPIATGAELAPVAAAVARHLPGVDPKPAGQHVCMYTLTPDENFIVDRHPAHENVWLFAGDSGHAFKFAPVIGQHLARLAMRVKTSSELDFLKLAGRSSAGG